jgi:very-short-patch-repair endonuclease
MQNRGWQVADTIEYNILKENAKANRCKQTEAESIFWNIAKGSGFGEKCRRQYIIGEYIVDFFFRKSRLIVEIDGGYHCTDEQQKEDVIRQNWLEQKGYKVIRFSNEKVICNPEEIIRIVKKYLVYE